LKEKVFVYIFRTKVNEGMVNFEALKNYLKENLILEKHISFKNLTLEKYNTYYINITTYRKQTCILVYTQGY
jgi:hypothetical protein